MLAVPRPSLQECLSLRPGALRGTLRGLSEIAEALPQGNIDAVQKARWRRLTTPRWAGVFRNFADVLRDIDGVYDGVVDKGLWPDVAELAALPLLVKLYTAISRFAADGVNKAMDLRLLLGAMQFYMLGMVLSVVVRRIEDPTVSKEDRARIQNTFSGLLLRKEQLMLTAEQRAALRKTMRAQLDAQLEQVQEETQLLDTIQAVKMKGPVDQESLAQAARIYAKKKGAGQPAGPGKADKAKAKEDRKSQR